MPLQIKLRHVVIHEYSPHSCPTNMLNGLESINEKQINSDNYDNYCNCLKKFLYFKITFEVMKICKKVFLTKTFFFTGNYAFFLNFCYPKTDC